MPKAKAACPGVSALHPGPSVCRVDLATPRCPAASGGPRASLRSEAALNFQWHFGTAISRQTERIICDARHGLPGVASSDSAHLSRAPRDPAQPRPAPPVESGFSNAGWPLACYRSARRAEGIGLPARRRCAPRARVPTPRALRAAVSCQLLRPRRLARAASR